MTTFIPSGNIRGPIIHETVLRLSITAGAKLLYGILCSAANDKDHCWLGLKTMADKLSSGISSIKRYLGELQEAGLISIQHRHGHSSLFTLLPPPAGKSACPAPEQNPASPNSDESVTPPLSGQPNLVSRQPTLNSPQPKTGCINNLNKTIKEISPSPQTPLAEPSVENKLSVGGGDFSDFEKVYSAYPRKEAKGLAKIAWTQLARNKALPQVQVILAAIERFSASHNWQRENGRFIPQLSNFLKGERWNDPLSASEIQENAVRKESEQNRRLLEQAEEQRRLECEEKKAIHKPVFDAFAAKFKGTFHFPLVFGKWMYLREKGLAPVASDVPENNELGILDFINNFQRVPIQDASTSVPIAEGNNNSASSVPNTFLSKMQSGAVHKHPRDFNDNKPRSAGEILKNSLLCMGIKPDNPLLRQAVAC